MTFTLSRWGAAFGFIGTIVLLFLVGLDNIPVPAIIAIAVAGGVVGYWIVHLIEKLLDRGIDAAGTAISNAVKNKRNENKED